MKICNFCGWEIANPDWYNKYNGAIACDNCLMDAMTEKEKESAI